MKTKTKTKPKTPVVKSDKDQKIRAIVAGLKKSAHGRGSSKHFLPRKKLITVPTENELIVAIAAPFNPIIGINQKFNIKFIIEIITAIFTAETVLLPN